jgi:hypothetical protein
MEINSKSVPEELKKKIYCQFLKQFVCHRKIKKIIIKKQSTYLKIKNNKTFLLYFYKKFKMQSKRRNSRKRSSSSSSSSSPSMMMRKNKTSRRMSKKKKSRSRKRQPNKWIKSVMQARKQMGVSGMQLLKKGTPLYKLSRQIYDGENSGMKRSSKKTRSRRSSGR